MDPIGLGIEDLDTPALLVDLDKLEKNIRTMADYYRETSGVLRPHQKGHRLLAIARKQLEAGAIGVSMTSFGLAEYYVKSGITNVLITNEVSGKNKLKRLCELSKLGDVTVQVDDLGNARQISETALDARTRVNVAVELYAGIASCGVPIPKALELVRGISALEGVAFKGLCWHDSTGGIADLKKRREAHFQALDAVADLRETIERAGYAVEMVSAGHTPTWNITPEHPRLAGVEVQVGNYVFSDWCSRIYPGLEVFEPSLTVLTRCISRPQPSEAMFDFGLNSCSEEDTGDYHNMVGPKFKDVEGMEGIVLREELAYASCGRANKNIRVGDVFEVIPPHGDTTAKLHDQYYGARNGKVEVVWPNPGRGLL